MWGVNLVLSASLITQFLGLGPASPAAPAHPAAPTLYHQRVCAVPSATASAQCNINVRTDAKNTPQATTLPAGFGPTQLHAAYNLPATASGAQTIAVVAAYDDPQVASDLNTYDQTYGLPVFPACSSTVTTACFQKVDQQGGTNYPFANSGWALEMSLDTQTAHQTCQNCKLILVEASSNSYADLMTAVDTAVRMGANEVSNSWDSAEFRGETTYDSHFNHPGVAFTFSAGDGGYGTGYPASSPYVTAVGGTSLKLNSSGVWASETAWTGTGSGCSALESKPTWQKDTLCVRRTMNDIAADADPNTGAAVYDSVPYQRRAGWFVVGGTSLGAPLVAAVYALGGGIPASAVGASGLYAQKTTTNLHDITTGSDGFCRGSLLCTAGTGYDGPTGLGTPIGLTDF